MGDPVGVHGGLHEGVRGACTAVQTTALAPRDRAPQKCMLQRGHRLAQPTHNADQAPTHTPASMHGACAY